jgi:hypothetical protein
MPMPAESAPKLLDCGDVVVANIIAPPQLNSLTDPEPLFHPPRA